MCFIDETYQPGACLFAKYFDKDIISYVFNMARRGIEPATTRYRDKRSTAGLSKQFYFHFTIFHTRLEVRNANGALNIYSCICNNFLFHLKLTLCKMAINFLSPGMTETLISLFRLYSPNETCKKRSVLPQLPLQSRNFILVSNYLIALVIIFYCPAFDNNEFPDVVKCFCVFPEHLCLFTSMSRIMSLK